MEISQASLTGIYFFTIAFHQDPPLSYGFRRRRRVRELNSSGMPVREYGRRVRTCG
ncbi:MAG: hypothetical protein HY308_06970 [Gammaproteobacteria bacterium]|nr:hypothetical protein [Gammaproteobacteria bacterium]